MRRPELLTTTAFATFLFTLVAAPPLAHAADDWWAFIQEPASTDKLSVETLAVLNPGSGQDNLRDEDEAETIPGIGLTCASGVYIGEALSDFMTKIDVGVSGNTIDVSGFSSGITAVTWPDQSAWGQHSNAADVTYKLSVEGDAPPEPSVTLTGTLSVDNGTGFQYPSGGGTTEIWYNDQKVGSLYVGATGGGSYSVTHPDGTVTQGQVGYYTTSHEISWVFATDAKEGDIIRVRGWQGGSISPTSSPRNGQMTWKVYVQGDANPDPSAEE